jgi:spermidine synthase
VACFLALAALLGAFIGADHITTLAEDKFYQDGIVFSATSPYQRIVVTRGLPGTACS